MNLLSILCLKVGVNVCPYLVFINVNTVASFNPLLTGPGDLLLNTTTRVNVFLAFVYTHLFKFSSPRTTSVNVVNNTSNPATVCLASHVTPRLLNPVTITTCSCVTLIPMVRPPVVHTLAAGRRHTVIVARIHAISGGRGVVFPIVTTAVVSVLLPSTTPLINYLVLNGLVHRSNIMRHLSGAIRGRLVGVAAMFLNISMNTATATRTFLGPGALVVLTVNVITFNVKSTNNILVTGNVGLFLGGGVGPLVNSTNISTIPVTTHMSRIINRRRGPNGFLLVRTVKPGITNIVNSTITTNFLVYFVTFWSR